jgi:hypothetical protein
VNPRATIARRHARGATPGWSEADEQTAGAWLASVAAGEPKALGVLDDGLGELLRAHRLDLLAYSTGATDSRRPARELASEVGIRRIAAASAEAVAIADGAGAPGVILKGPAFGQRYWGNALLRESSDVDLLVRPADVAKVRRAFTALGYQARANGMPAWYEQRWFYHEAVRKPDWTEPSVELHWDFMRSGFGSNDIGRLIDEAETVEVCGVKLPSPSPAWQLVTNAAHCVHELFRPRQLLDIAMVARAAGDGDLLKAQEIARAAGVATMLHYALAVSAERLQWQTSPLFASLNSRRLGDFVARRYIDGLPHFGFPTRTAFQLHHFANPLLTCDGPRWVGRLPYALLTDRGRLAANLERLRRRLR